MARQRQKSLTNEQVESVSELIPHIPHLMELIADDLFWRRLKTLVRPWMKWVAMTFFATETGLHLMQSLLARIVSGGGGFP
jgi:hypothetical protein